MRKEAVGSNLRRHLEIFVKQLTKSNNDFSSSAWYRGTGRPGDQVSIPSRGKSILPLTSVFRPTPGPIQPPAQGVPGVYPRG
jgi:hypothetical protein